MSATNDTTNGKSCSNPTCPEANPQPLTNFCKDSKKKDGLRSRCKTCSRADGRSYTERNREKRQASQRDYYARRGDIQRTASRNWKANNQERNQELWQEWYDQNADKRRAYHRQYARVNAEAMRHKSRTRRARLLNAEGSFTEAEFQAKLEAAGFKCHYCGAPLTKDTATRDHVIPLTKGGRNDIGNIVPACMSCNAQKRTKDASKFKARRISS